jgi:hypothetical protein
MPVLKNPRTLLVKHTRDLKRLPRASPPPDDVVTRRAPSGKAGTTRRPRPANEHVDHRPELWVTRAGELVAMSNVIQEADLLDQVQDGPARPLTPEASTSARGRP